MIPRSGAGYLVDLSRQFVAGAAYESFLVACLITHIHVEKRFSDGFCEGRCEDNG